MQLVYDVKGVSDNNSEVLKRFDSYQDAMAFKNKVIQVGKYDSVRLVPVILNDDFTDPIELTDK